MFIRPCYRFKNGKRHAYWALVESYRTSGGPRQRVVSYLGQTDAPRRSGIHQLASGKPYQRMLFEDIEPAWVEVDTRNIRVDRCLAFGGPWLGLELLKRLGLPELLERLLPNGRECVPWSLTALVLVIARLCDAASELHIAEQFYKDSALCDVLGVRAGGINEDRLYRALDRLLPHKQTLECHLKERLGAGMGREHRIPLKRIRCMTMQRYQELKTLWAGGTPSR